MRLSVIHICEILSLVFTNPTKAEPAPLPGLFASPIEDFTDFLEYFAVFALQILIDA